MFFIEAKDTKAPLKNKEVIAKLALPGKNDDFWGRFNAKKSFEKMHSLADETYTMSIGEEARVEAGPKRAVLTGEWSFAITSKGKQITLDSFD